MDSSFRLKCKGELTEASLNLKLLNRREQKLTQRLFQAALSSRKAFPPPHSHAFGAADKALLFKCRQDLGRPRVVRKHQSHTGHFGVFLCAIEEEVVWLVGSELQMDVLVMKAS